MAGMHPGYFPVLIWSLFILASFWGYGEALRRWLNRKEFTDIGWGLTAAWGMGVTLILGGALMAVHLAKAANLALLVLFGAGFAIYFLAKSAFAPKPKSTKSAKSASPAEPLHEPTTERKLFDRILIFFAALAFASAIAWPLQVDPNDDVVCYLAFPKKILDTGTLLEPFNVRRMGTYGGQALLQAQVMIFGAERNGHVPDRAFGMLLLFGMVWHLTRGVAPRYAILRFLTVGLLFFVSVPRINTGSHLTGAAMLLALILTLSKSAGTTGPLLKTALAPALLLAATGSLRMTYLLCATGIVVLEALFRFRETAPSTLEIVKRSAVAVLPLGIGAFVLLIPWMAVLWQSNHTPMYPPIMGTMNPEFTILGSKAGKLVDVAHGAACLLMPEVLVLLFGLTLAAAARQKSLAVAAALAAVLVSWFTAYKFGVTVLSEGYRYTFPMLMPVVLWLLSTNLPKELAESSEPPKTVWMALILGLLCALNLPNAGRELATQAESLPGQIFSRDRMVNPALTNANRELQNYTPAGSKILVAVDTPYGFDFARNRIDLVDVPGASAIGKWPLHRGPEALRKYLLDLGYSYIIASDFDNAMLLYTRKHWTEHQRPEWFFKEVWGKYFLDFMDNVDSLARTQRVVATAANLRLIDLSSPAQ